MENVPEESAERVPEKSAQRVKERSNQRVPEKSAKHGLEENVEDPQQRASPSALSTKGADPSTARMSISIVPSNTDFQQRGAQTVHTSTL